MATASLPILRWNSLLTWLPDFLREELLTYPGRVALVSRMVVAATLIMIVGMTFRIPYTYQGAIYALMISRESRQATLKSAGTILLVTGIGAAYLLISVSFVINSPLLHCVWVIGSFLLVFYAISTLTNYTAAVIFAIMISLGVPLWDRVLPSETNVEDTLWLCLAVVIGVVITAAVELVFERQQPGDDVVIPISDRLAATERLMTRYAERSSIDAATKEQIMQFAMRGTSLLRRILRRSDYPVQYSVEMAGVTALVGRLVDLAATLTQLRFEASASDQKRLRNLASALANIRNELLNRRIPDPLQFNTVEEPAGVPLLREMEHTVSLIPQAFAPSRSTPAYFSLVDDIQRPSLLASDAFVNPDHLRFALKGCLAASICYVIYNAMGMARHQHIGKHMLAHGTLYDRCIPPETNPSNPRRPCWRIGSWDGVTDAHSAASRFHRWFCAPFCGRHRPGCLVHDLEPPPIVLRYADRSVFLPDQCNRIQNADLTRSGERPRRRHLARPVRNVVNI